MIHTPTDPYDIVIIGSGASGMMAAVTCARQGASVLVLEHKDRPGKKILITGNGKCNLTNERMVPEAFRGDPALVTGILNRYGWQDTVDFFHSIGIPVRSRSGYLYPASEQAASVTAAFENELQRLGVDMVYRQEPKGIARRDSFFTVTTNESRYLCRRLIICCGGKAAPQTGSDGSLYSCIKGLGHHFTDLVPALCAFNAEGLPFKKIGGVRTEAALTLSVNGKVCACDQGELQFTDYGLSGIPVFQVSRFASLALQHGGNALISIDLLPDYSSGALLEELEFRREHFSRETAAWLLNGLLPAKLIPPLLAAAGLAMEKKIYKISPEDLQKLAASLKEVRVKLLSVRGFENAQVTCGGIRAGEIDPATLESALVPGLYFAGEVLDCDAICGGYNLQWAWATGTIAGKHAFLSLR